MSALAPFLDHSVPSGIYRWSSRVRPTTVARAAAAAGWRCFYLDGRQISDKPTFLHALAAAAEFPAYFGHNWDALEESLLDLSWAPAAGYLLLYDRADRFARAAPQDWAMALEVLAETCRRWQAAGTPWFVLLRGLDSKE
jgi:hypothetical protein